MSDAGPAGIHLRPLLRPSTTKLLLVVADGLGGYADDTQASELEDARTPHLDALAASGVLGLLEPVGPGVTPGSGPGHLALFGYDPLEYRLGRGLLTAAGIGVDLGAGDVAARGNLCRLDEQRTIVDRRAGRIEDEKARRSVERLRDGIRVEGATVELHHVKQHRFLLVLRGDGLDGRIADTDPGETGRRPNEPQALAEEARHTAGLVGDIVRQAESLLAGEDANGILLRGFEGHHRLPSFEERYGSRAAAIASYPMYRGVASLVGMDVLEPAESLGHGCRLLAAAWDDYDYFFFHYKDADSAGENGDRDGKMAAIEALDRIIPVLWHLSPDVMAVTGDHATPSQLRSHSWHPVPLVVWAGGERDDETHFGERWCRRGALGRRPSLHLMPLMLAMAGRLNKFGA